MKKISKIASLLLAGSAAFIVGCGHSSSTGETVESSTPTVSGTALASYRADATVIAVGDTNKTGLTNENGVFSVGKPTGFKYIEIVGGRNSDTNTTITYTAKAPSGYYYVSPLTTIITTPTGDANETLVNKLGPNIFDVDYNKVDDLNIKKKAVAIKLVVEKVLAKKEDPKVITALAQALNDVNLTEINTTTVTKLVDTVATKVKTVAGVDVNLSDINTTVQQIAEANSPEAIDSNLTVAEQIIAKDTVKLGVNYIELGDTKVLVAKNEFVPITLDSDKNITDFYNVTINFNEGDIKYLPDDLANNKTYEANLTIAIKEDSKVSSGENRWVKLRINNVQITLDKNSSNPVTTKFIKGQTTISASASSDLKTLYDIVGGGTTANVGDLTNTDFGFNVQTILNNLTSNEDKINKAIDTLNNYLKQPGIYDVNISFDVNDTTLENKLLATEITGKVTVVNNNNHAPVINKVKILNDDMEPVTEVNENSLFSIEVNATDPDGDNLTYTLVDSEGNVKNCNNPSNNICYFDLSAGKTETYTVKVCDPWGACTEEKVNVPVENLLKGLDYNTTNSTAAFSLNYGSDVKNAVVYYNFDTKNIGMQNKQTNNKGIYICDNGTTSVVDTDYIGDVNRSCVLIIPIDTIVDGKTFAVDFGGGNVIRYNVPSNFL